MFVLSLHTVVVVELGLVLKVVNGMVVVVMMVVLVVLVMVVVMGGC